MKHFGVAFLLVILFGVCQDSWVFVGASEICGPGNFNSSTGVITSPNYPDLYPNSVICEWIIEDPNEQPIGVYFEEFSLENHATCNYDSVEIRNGSSATSPLVGLYCGTTIPEDLENIGSKLYVKFKTDGSVQSSGFKLAWGSAITESGIHGGHFVSLNGVITSPNYPAYYPDNFEVQWIIDAPTDHLVVLNVINFDIQSDPQCALDFLEIRSGSTIPGESENSAATSTLLGKYCGSSIPKRITSIGNQIFLRFNSSLGANSHEGFIIEWDSRTLDSIAGCNRNLTSSQGTIFSPDYPDVHNSPVTCNWNIRVSAGSVIQFLLAHLEFGANEDCSLNFVEINDGANMHGKTLGTYCHTINHPLYVETTSNIGSVKFRSDSAGFYRRFQIVYHTICHNKVYGTKGVIESPNFPNQYPNRENCSWIIEAPVGTTLNLRFSHFDLDGGLEDSCNKDYVEISEGQDDKPDREIGKFCSSTAPPSHVIVSSERQIFLRFHSDDSGSGIGFRLEWSAIVRNTIQPPSPSCLIWNDPVPQRADYTYTPGIGGHKLHTEAVPWNEARLTCEEEGGYLAIINSDAELDAIIELFSSNLESITGSQYPNFTSIGFHGFYSEGQFVTIHGQPLDRTGFFHWGDEQLYNDGESENCGALSLSGELNEVSCENNYAFVCEVPMY